MGANRPQTVRRLALSTSTISPLTNIGRELRQAKNCPAAALPFPCSRRSVSRFTSVTFQPMSSFDPATVRKAVEEFTPRRPQKFQDLLPAKDVITELRQKRASYRSIADLLTQHCLPASKTAIAVFCHQVLGESVRPHKRPGRKRPAVSAPPNGGEMASNPIASHRSQRIGRTFR